MNTRTPYDTLLDKSKDAIVRELEQLIGAAEIALAEGSRWLISQRAPVGPLMAEHDVSHVYKCVWAHYMAGSDGHYVAELLDWLMEHARQPNGDLFFPTEPPDHRDDVRVYRALVCLRIAALTGHPMAQDAQIVQRALQYQDAVTGGCSYFIGEDPDDPQWPEFIGVGETAFLGEFGIAANFRQQAIRAGDWLRKLVLDNQSHMTDEGIFYCLADRDRALITRVAAGEKIFKMVNNIEMYEKALAGKIAEALALQERMNHFVDVLDAIPSWWTAVKTALHLMGICGPSVVAPLPKATAEERELIRMCLTEYGLLP
jgi:hypothetical protein